MFDCGASDVSQLGTHRNSSPWQLCVNLVGNWHFLVFNGLILLTSLTGFWPWHILAIAAGGHLLRTTECTLLPCHSPLPWNTNCTFQGKRSVYTGLAAKIICALVTAYYWETSRPRSIIAVSYCAWKHRSCILGNTWWEYIVTLSHSLFLSFPFPLFALYCSFSFSHTHPRT